MDDPTVEKTIDREIDGRSPAWDRLGSLRFLVALTVAVLLGLLASLLMVMRDASEEASDASHAESVAEVTDVSLELLLDLQVERGYSIGYLAARGTRFVDDMAEARQLTDAALDQTDRRWGELRSEVDALTRQRLDSAFDLRRRLEEIRERVNRAPLTNADTEVISSDFATPIEELTDGFSSIVSAQGDADAVRRRVALAQIALAVRASGNERSLLIEVFTADEPLTDTQIEAIHAWQALVTESLTRFSELATPEQLRRYEEIRESSSFQETDAAIQLALDRRDEGDYDVDPAILFVTATERVEQLTDLARQVSDDLAEAADNQQAAAQRTVRQLSAVAVVIVTLATLFGLAAASSIRHRRRAEDAVRGIAETLQRSLLPADLPRVEGVELLTRYEASTEYGRVGGDWFDAVPLPDGRLGLVIGDVVGHGIQAAAAMGEVRHSLRAMTNREGSPELVLQRLSELLRQLHPDTGIMATVVYAIFDPPTGLLRYANAGHPAPLIRTPDGDVRVLDEPRSVLVGTHFDTDYEAGEATLEPGSTLLLYTDGLVERVGENLDESTDRLVDALRSVDDDLGTTAEVVYERLIDGGPSDDLAILLLRYDGAPASGVDVEARSQIFEDPAKQA